MEPALPPVNWLRVFEVTARHLSVSSAARELHVTPSAVSQHIRLLEHRLKRQLFQRHARGLSLTAAGEALVPVCRESFERLEMTIQEIFGHQADDRLVVRVAFGFARSWLMDSIAAFADRHPRVQLRVLASVWAAEPLASDVQLDIRLASAAVRGMDSCQLTHDAIFPVCSPRLRRRCKRLSHPGGLNDVRLLHTLGFQQGWAQWLAAAGVRRVAVRTDMEFDSMQLAIDMALQGQGVALARTSYVIDLLKSGRLVRLFDLSLQAKDNIHIVHVKGLPSMAPALQLKEWLMARHTVA